jgi:hypothetical protein
VYSYVTARGGNLSKISRCAHLASNLKGDLRFSKVLGLRAARMVQGIALLVATSAMVFGQQPAITQDAIFGFEAAGGWQVSVTALGAATTLSNIRTQGGAAYSLTNPGNEAKVTSLPVSSAARQLTNLGVLGASLAVDIRFPAAKNLGSLRLSLTSVSRGLHKIPLGKVDLKDLRPGTYQTISFPITDQARRALTGAAFNDLSFEFALSTQGTGEFLLDNLRVRSVQGVTATAATQPPPGYGGSVDFDISGGIPEEAIFDVGPVQVPDRFHLKAGGSNPGTTVQLDLGYSATAIIATCLYVPDTLDVAQKSYKFSSCTGGPLPGDIVGAAWGRLGITGGGTPMRLRAQLARRPVGDQTGSGIIPPMPTFWGDEDACTPAAPSGQVVTTSQSCSDTLAQTSKIVDDYFKAVNLGGPGGRWIVAPVPEGAKRHGTGIPAGAASFAAEIPRVGGLKTTAARFAGSSSNLINEGEHINKGGLFDAYWALTGGLNYNGFPNTDRATTRLDTDFSAHGVFLGEDVSVLHVAASADSDTGESVPVHLPSSANADLHTYLFGIEYPDASFHTSSSDPLDKTFSIGSKTFDAPPIRFWIFAVKIGVRADASVLLSGGIQAKGVSLTLTPRGTLGVHLFGGIDVFVASGGVDATVDLLDIRVPVTADATWFLDRSPSSCSGSLTGSLNGDLTIASGGGHVDLVASFGICPFCDDESVTLFEWDPLFTSTSHLFDATMPLGTFELPNSICTGNAISASIQSPNSDSGTYYGTLTYPLKGIASSTNTTNIGGSPALSCNDFTWSVLAPDVLTGAGCNASVTFANTAHQATINLSVSHSVTNAFGHTLTETGSAIPRSVNVTLLTGVKVIHILNLETGLLEPFKPFSDPTGAAPLTSSAVGGRPSLDGYYLESSLLADQTPDQNIRYTWSVNGAGGSSDISCNSPAYNALHFIDCLVLTVVPAGSPIVTQRVRTFWNPPADVNQARFTVTVTATDLTTGLVVATDSFPAAFYGVN